MKKTRFFSIFLIAVILGAVWFGSLRQVRGHNNQTDPNHPAAAEKKGPEVLQDPNSIKGDNETGNTELANPLKEDPDSRLPEFFDICDKIFSSYVTNEGLVQYAALRRSRADLLPVMRLMREIDPLHLMSLSIEGKTAFWINVYNLCILQLIVDNYPIQPKWYMIRYPNDSIMQISNPWTKNYFWVQGLQYNLEEIEQEFLLNRTQDPRICFALSNASLGGGRQRRQAYRAENLDQQLDKQVRLYLENPIGYQLDQPNKTISLSVLFQTKRATFLASEFATIKKFRDYPDLQRCWLNFLAKYIPQKDIEFIESNPCTFKMISYDWHLDAGQ
ncbi:MAG TPA: DUF547 domain-containing protein [Anaerohalosphaeraceae bacterium]|nr:DUF547 domain-containing protein [Anaerohalosphaeraceae bacterium]